MKNLASAKEKGISAINRNPKNHGEFNLKFDSLWFFIVFLGIIFFLTPASPEEFQFSLPGKIERVCLDNGMVVLIKERRNLPLCCLFLTIFTGTNEEGFSNSGISHFVEHMVFKGTLRRKVGDIAREIESYGGKIDAFTSFDYTAYKIIVPKEFTSGALEVLADMMQNAAFEQQELEREKQVVLKEIRMNYDDPEHSITRLLMQTAYTTHRYRYPILGEENAFNKLTRKDLLDFYQAAYIPNNMVLAIVGDISAEEGLKLAKQVFKKFPPKENNFTLGCEPAQEALRQRETEFTAGLTYLNLGFHSVAVRDADLFALDTLAAVLGAGKSSRLYELICNKRKLAYAIGAINYTPQEPGLFIISCLLEEKNRKHVQSLILKQIEQLKKRPIPEAELQSAQNKITSAILLDSQTIESQAQDLGLNELIAKDFRFTEKYIQKIKQTNSQDIIMAANKYLNKAHLSIAALIPRQRTYPANLPPEPDRQKSGIKAREIAVEHLVKEQEDFLAVAAYKNAQVGLNKGKIDNGLKKYVLDNGLTLLVKEDRELPLVSIKAVFKGGLRAEDAQTNGVCNLVAQMFDKGTKTQTATEIANLVESKGGQLTSFSGNNSFGLSLDLLSKDFEPMLALLADLIINVQFPKRQFLKLKAENLAQLKSYEDDIFEFGMRALKLALFKKHPYRFLTIGDEKSLVNLNRKNLKDFYRNFCVEKNIVLAIFGDVQAEEVLAKVKQHFAKLNAAGPAPISLPEEPAKKGVRTSFKYLPKEQSLVLMGFSGTSVYSQDKYRLELICQLLSQASGKFFTQLRERTGFAYTLGAYSVVGLDPGYLVIYVATTEENVEAVKTEILQQLTLLKQKPVSEEELRQAKRTLLVQKLITRQKNSENSLEDALNELYGLGFDHYLAYAQQINLCSPADIQHCAQQYFDLDNYAQVVVGPAKTEKTEITNCSN